MDQASELFKANEDHEILKRLRAAGASGDQQRVTEMTVKFEEHMQQLEEVRLIVEKYPRIHWSFVFCLDFTICMYMYRSFMYLL